jgi:hypothetical protein
MSVRAHTVNSIVVKGRRSEVVGGARDVYGMPGRRAVEPRLGRVQGSGQTICSSVSMWDGRKM